MKLLHNTRKYAATNTTIQDKITADATVAASSSLLNSSVQIRANKLRQKILKGLLIHYIVLLLWFL